MRSLAGHSGAGSAGKRLKTLLMALPLMAAVTASPALANDNPLDKVPDPVQSVLQFLQKSGVKLTYLGDHGGLEGYMGESSTGKVQTFYVTPDGRHVVAGVMFRNGGINVTGMQIEDMKTRFEEARARMENAEESVGALSLEEAGEVGEETIIPAVTDLSKISDSGDTAVVTDRWKSDIDAEQFLKDVEGVAWFSVGLDEAPVVYMVADPQCPFCHAAWSQLRPKVMSGDVNVRIILIDALTGSRDKAISLLARDEPGRAWFTGEGSMSGMQVAAPPEQGSAEYLEASRYLMVNKDFAINYGFDATPYMVYEGDDGVLRVSRGLPPDMDAYLANLPTKAAE